MRGAQAVSQYIDILTFMRFGTLVTVRHDATTTSSHWVIWLFFACNQVWAVWLTKWGGALLSAHRSS